MKKQTKIVCFFLALTLVGALKGCSSSESITDQSSSFVTSTASSATLIAKQAAQCVPSAAEDSSVRTERILGGLTGPWAMAFLPDNRLLVTQKSGVLLLISADANNRTALSWPTPGPNIRDGGQGGLLDVVLDPDFASSLWIYFTYQEPDVNNTGGTAVGRVQLQNNVLTNFQRLYQQTPKVAWDGPHFGSRLAFGADKSLFVSLGDRGQDNPAAPTTDNAQNLAKSLGKVIRLKRDGSIPSDNPFVNQPGALPEIWSLGHRNPQGLTFDAKTGRLWATEHGAQGGDEVNFIAAGSNYGWPLRSYSCPYGAPIGDACRVGGGVHAPLNGLSFTEPLTFWAPVSVAPSNIVVYSGAKIADWKDNLIVGALAGKQLWRISLKGGVVDSCNSELSFLNKRLRDVREGPDGWIWVLTDDGEIHRVVR